MENGNVGKVHCEPKFKRVAIVGSHWTGKSSLLEALPIIGKVNETAREIIDEYGTTPDKLSYTDKVVFENRIINSHIIKESEALRKYGSFVSDRSVYDVLAYAKSLGIKDEDYLHLEELSSANEIYDKVFYLPIEFPLSVDYARWGWESFQKEIDKSLRSLLEERGYEIEEVRGTVEERVNQIIFSLYK